MTRGVSRRSAAWSSGGMAGAIAASLGVLAWFGLLSVKRRWRTTWGSAAMTVARV